MAKVIFVKAGDDVSLVMDIAEDTGVVDLFHFKEGVIEYDATLEDQINAMLAEEDFVMEWGFFYHPDDESINTFASLLEVAGIEFSWL